MQRPRSLILGAGATYHVATRGVRRLPIVYDDLDRQWFFADLTTAVRNHGWRCHAYCLMTNHYHLLLDTPEPDLSVGMWRLNQRHALRINRRHGFTGHVFEGRFFAELIEDETHFLGLARYIDQNPVRAGLCRRAELWPWSGCAATVGLRPAAPFFDPTDVLASYSRDKNWARQAYSLSLQDLRRPGPGGRVPSPGLGTGPEEAPSRSRMCPKSAPRAGARAATPAGRRR
jgi:putative transposase